MNNFWIKLKLKNKIYKCPVGIFTSYDWWDSGNGGCDCNRLIFIKEQYPEVQGDINCGHEIELVDYFLEEEIYK
jgi:hypothetical protein